MITIGDILNYKARQLELAKPRKCKTCAREFTPGREDYETICSFDCATAFFFHDGFTPGGMNPLFDGVPARSVQLDDDGAPRVVQVASTEFEDVLFDARGEYVSGAARQFDESIYAFVSPGAMLCSNRKLRHYVAEYIG